MTEPDPLTPEQLETQKHNLAFFKGAVEALDRAMDCFQKRLHSDFRAISSINIMHTVIVLKKEYYDAIKAIEERQSKREPIYTRRTKKFLKSNKM